MSDYLHNLWDWSPQLLHGVQVTLLVTIVSTALAIVAGLLIAIARIWASERGGAARILGFALRAYVETLRGLPIIVTLFIIYFGLPTVGLTIASNALIAGILGLSLALAAYLAEVFRAAILSVESGQMEAALSFGMKRSDAYMRIVIPQALVVAVPTLGGYFISTLKDSSLLGFISVVELMRTAIDLVSVTFLAFQIYLTIGAIYLVLSLVASWVVAHIEQRLRPLEKAYTGGAVGDRGMPELAGAPPA
ncbi:MAG: polar amino acid transport system permease protein [Solirubrobacteraceae bacterium]|jgi:His/Glu/Gln/Arg/opine family amino acid ABC transporter permease subunit|nr:polar amino acid transport system permease protein [Solirubrobacteraceae bacterium]